MNALGRIIRAGVGRHRMQTAVMALTVLIAVAASVMATGVLAASRAPFDHAFAKQDGAQLVASFDGSKASASQIAATRDASGVTAAAGPFQTLTVQAKTGTHNKTLTPPGVPPELFAAGVSLPAMTVAGRADAGGAVDDVTMLSGHWVDGPGQIVIGATVDMPLTVGMHLVAPGAPGDPTLTVVGLARSVSQTADAWVSPSQLAALTPPQIAPAYQMLYRFAHAGDASQVSADRAAITSASAAGSVTGTQSYLTIRTVSSTNTAAFVPFIAAFGVLGLILSALIIGVVISGAVGAARWRIGVLKSLGFTPGQLVRAYLAQALIPAVVGAGLGVLVGNLLAVPVLHEAEGTYGTGALSIPVWVDVVVPLAGLMLVSLASIVPALRAGRLSAVTAMALGRSPRAGGGRRVQRLLGRLPLPRSLTLGLANPFARPSRSAPTAAAVLLGATTITFAVGLVLSLNGVQRGRSLDSSGAVVVDIGGNREFKDNGPITVHPGPPAKPADPTAVAAAIRNQPGTRAFYGTAQAQVAVSGISGVTTVVGDQGDSSWATHQMISGHWLDGPDQIVLSSQALRRADTRVGGMLTLGAGARSVDVRVVGEVFDLQNDGLDLYTDASDLSRLGVNAWPDTFFVDLESQTNLGSYLGRLNATLAPLGGAGASANYADHSDVIVTMDALVVTLTLMLVAVAGLGVLNTVVLDTRERVHDLGVLKALGFTPRQTVTSVITSVAGLGLVAGAMGVPVGVALHHYVMPLMGKTADTKLPSVDIAVYHLAIVLPLLVGGLVIAVVGALVPATWAANLRTATALRTE